jgi:hypothetical protein
VRRSFGGIIGRSGAAKRRGERSVTRTTESPGRASRTTNERARLPADLQPTTEARALVSCLRDEGPAQNLRSGPASGRQTELRREWSSEHDKTAMSSPAFELRPSAPVVTWSPLYVAYDVKFTAEVVLRRLLLLGLPLAAVGWTGCCKPPACPVSDSFEVLITPAGMMLNGVQAVMTGPVNVTMDCQDGHLGAGCWWPTTVQVVPGTYSLQVSAPGHVTTTIQVVVAVDVPPTVACGCPGDTIKPSTVSLSPADGGVD